MLRRHLFGEHAVLLTARRRTPARQEFVRDDAERKHVRPAVPRDLAALRGDIRPSQQRIAQSGGFERLDDTESRHAGQRLLIVRHEHVAWMQRAVKHPGFGCRGQRRRERAEETGNARSIVIGAERRSTMSSVSPGWNAITTYGVVPSSPTSSNGTISG